MSGGVFSTDSVFTRAKRKRRHRFSGLFCAVLVSPGGREDWVGPYPTRDRAFSEGQRWARKYEMRLCAIGRWK